MHKENYETNIRCVKQTDRKEGEEEGVGEGENRIKGRINCRS